MLCRAGARPEEAGAGAVVGTGPWPNPPTEAEQLQALMAAANGELQSIFFLLFNPSITFLVCLIL